MVISVCLCSPNVLVEQNSPNGDSPNVIGSLNGDSPIMNSPLGYSPLGYSPNRGETKIEYVVLNEGFQKQ